MWFVKRLGVAVREGGFDGAGVESVDMAEDSARVVVGLYGYVWGVVVRKAWGGERKLHVGWEFTWRWQLPRQIIVT